MKIVLCILASVLITACRKSPTPPAAMRLRVEPGKVLWGKQSLPTHPDDLAAFLNDRIASGQVEPVVRVDFSKEVTGDRMGQIFNAVIFGEGCVNMTLDFSISGHSGRDFRLMLPTECCERFPSEPFSDEWSEGLLEEFQGRRYLEFDIALREDEFTAGGEPLEPDEIVPMLMSRRRLAEEVTVHINIGSEDIAGTLLPLLAACQSLEMEFNIGTDQREADEREQRRLAKRLMEPVRRRSPGFEPGSPFALPDVQSNFPMSPPMLPERWLMSCPDSQELIRYLIAGHGPG